MPSLRVMTYNIWRGGRGVPLLHRAVREAEPDVLLVNESPKLPLLWRPRCHDLARAWGMRYAVGGRAAGSNMIVVRPGVSVESTYASRIPQPLFQPRRGIAAAQLRVEGAPVSVVSCHLSLVAERRATEVERVIAVARRLPGPVVVAGDLNERPTGPSWHRLAEAGYVDHGTDAWPTFPAAAPAKRIDALLVPAATPVSHHGDPGVDEELQRQASDHRAVLAVIEV